MRYTPEEGVLGYEVRARSPIKGSFSGSCNENTHICELTDLPPGTDFTLWLQSCDSPFFKHCFLRAVQFETYTLASGKELT